MQRHADEPLLRPVVQVPLDPPPLGVGGRDDPALRGPHTACTGADDCGEQCVGAVPAGLAGEPPRPVSSVSSAGLDIV